LEVNSIAEIFKRVAAFVGMEAKEVEGVSGHSVRVSHREVAADISP
jgi:hypothetical protein